MDGILINSTGLFVSYRFLKDRGISEKSIGNWTLRGQGNRLYAGGMAYIGYDSIPAPTRAKLPPQRLLEAEATDNAHKVLAGDVEQELRQAHGFEFARYRAKHQQTPGLTAENVTEAAQLEAVFARLLSLKEQHSGKGFNDAAFDAFEKLYPGRYKHRNSFYNVLSQAKHKGADFVAQDARKTREAAPAYDDRLYYWLRQLVGSPVKLSNPEIAAKLSAICEQQGISKVPGNMPEWVKKHRRILLKNPDLFASRYGATEAFNKVQPYAKMIKARNANTQWQIDGKELSFYKAGYEKLWVFAVRDSHSGKIVGYSIGESENTEVILAGLADAVAATGCLPSEIVSDNHSFNKTGEAANFKEQVAAYGVTWEVSHNPRYKSGIERFFKHIGEHYLKQYPGYAGQGIRTRDREGRPAQELLDQYQRADTFRTDAEIRAVIMLSLRDYNAAPLRKEGKSPNELYEISEQPHAVKIDLFERAKLFTKRLEYPVTRGQINITRAGVLHEFQLSAEQLQQCTYFDRVVVRYDDLRESIYLYHPKTDRPLGEVRPKQGIHAAKADQTEADKRLLLQNKGRLTGAKSRAAKDNRKTLEAAGPDAYEIINRATAPKDVLSEIERDYQLRQRAADMGIDLTTATTGQPVPILTNPSLKPKALENKSPFSVRGKHQVGMIDTNTDND